MRSSSSSFSSSCSSFSSFCSFSSSSCFLIFLPFLLVCFFDLTLLLLFLFLVLFLKADGSLWSSGYNQHGKVGAGELGHSIKLTKIVDAGVAGISAGHHHSIYWTTNGEVYAFGSDESGQLGLGRKIRMTSPHVIYDPSQ